MRLFFAVILGMMLLPCGGYAQENNVSTAVDSLESVLSTLKESVEKLSLDNDQLAAKDKYINGQVLQLQMQLGQLEAQGVTLNQKTNKLQEKNPRRAEQIDQLEKENADLDDHTQRDQSSIKLVQESLDAGYQEEQKLLLHLKAMTNSLPLPVQVQSPESQAAERRQKEKLRLMKMIYESQQRQESLHEAIMEFQKNTPLMPAASALAHQQLLKEQIKDLEAQIASFAPESPSTNPGYAHQWDDTQLQELELELKALENNYLQLKDLMDQMGKKAQAARMTVSQHIEGEKLQGSINDLNRQGESLRADLDDLRSQMVDLDKRKTNLEEMIRQLP